MIAMKPDLLASLTSSADAEVDQVLLHGSSGMLTAPRTEVGFVAAVTLGGVPGIASEWSRLLRPHGFKLEMHGVFCHVAPVVEFQTARNSTIGCELADLLVVIDYVGLNGQVRRKASLIQAKMASKANRVSLTGPSSVKQLYLYQNWPRFKFRESVYGSNQYDLTSTGNGHSGSFGVIDRHLKSSTGRPPVWTQHDAQPTPVRITNEPTLGEFLSRMIGGPSGRCGRIAFQNGTDDWSQVVDLLLTVTYGKVFRHPPTLGSVQSPRGVTFMAFLSEPHGQRSVNGHATGYGWRPPFDGFETIEDDNPGGISVLRVIVSRGS